MFGDTKFVPELGPDSFKKIVRSSENYEAHKKILENILEKVELEVYTEDEPFYRIGFRDDSNETTLYYSSTLLKQRPRRLTRGVKR